MANELDALNVEILKCLECGDFYEPWDPLDEGLCMACVDVYCQHCSKLEEDCDCLCCFECGLIVYECGCEEDDLW